MAVKARAADTPSTHALMEFGVLKSKFKTKKFYQILLSVYLNSGEGSSFYYV